MKFRSIAMLFAVVISSAVAHAQLGVYATFEAQQFTRTGLRQFPLPGTLNHDSPILYGPTVGAYYTVTHVPRFGTLKTGPIALGVDVRGDFLNGDLYKRSDGLIGLRISPKTALMSFVPYLQGSAGIGHTKLPRAQFYTNNWSYQGALGVDHKLRGRIDWRIVEVSAGFLGNYVAGTNSENTNLNVNLSSGLVVRLTGK